MDEQDEVRVTIRLARRLREAVRRLARQKRRSLNNQIVVLLECAVGPDAAPDSPPAARREETPQ